MELLPRAELRASPSILNPRRGSVRAPNILCRSLLQFALGFTLLTGGCLRRRVIWVVPGSTRSHLVFGISDKVGGDHAVSWSLLKVYRCGVTDSGGGIEWLVTDVAPLEDTGPTRVVYGDVPPGYQSSQGPAPLTAGCYWAEVGGGSSGKIQFKLNEDGSASPGS